MRWLVALCVLAVPLASAVAVEPGDVEFSFFRDEAQGIYVLTPDAEAAYSAAFWGGAGNYVNNGREWDFFFTDLDGPFRLDAAGTIQVETQVGGSSQEAGTAMLAWELKVAGSAVATGEAKRITYTQNKATTTWSVSAPDAVISNGDSLRVYTTDHIAKGARMDLAASSLFLPVLEGTPPVAAPSSTSFENVTGIPLERSFANATGTTVLNWTVEEANGTIQAHWNLTAGTVNLTVLGPGNETLYNGTLNGTGSVDIAENLPGQWNVTLSAHNATGSLHLLLSSDPGTHDHGDDDHSDQGNGTDDPHDEEHPKDSPLPVVLALVAIAAAARSRRR